MRYYYLVADDTTSITTITQYDYASFYGWSCDWFTVYIYAHIIYRFEGDTYIIREFDAESYQEFNEYMRWSGYVSSEIADVSRFQIILFEQNGIYQAMMRENLDDMTIDGYAVNEVLIWSGISPCIAFAELLRRFMPKLKLERSCILQVAKRIQSLYLATDTIDYSLSNVQGIFNVVPLIGIVYGDETECAGVTLRECENNNSFLSFLKD